MRTLTTLAWETVRHLARLVLGFASYDLVFLVSSFSSQGKLAAEIAA